MFIMGTIWYIVYFMDQDHICNLMVSIIATIAGDHGIEFQCGKPNTMQLVFAASLHSIIEYEKRLIGLESGWCVRVKRHVYLCTVVSAS